MVTAFVKITSVGGGGGFPHVRIRQVCLIIHRRSIHTLLGCENHCKGKVVWLQLLSATASYARHGILPHISQEASRTGIRKVHKVRFSTNQGDQLWRNVLYS